MDGWVFESMQGGKMLRLAVRIFLLLAILAAGRILMSVLLRPIERSEVTVVVMPAADCASEAFAPDGQRGN